MANNLSLVLFCWFPIINFFLINFINDFREVFECYRNNKCQQLPLSRLSLTTECWKNFDALNLFISPREFFTYERRYIKREFKITLVFICSSVSVPLPLNLLLRTSSDFEMSSQGRINTKLDRIPFLWIFWAPWTSISNTAICL